MKLIITAFALLSFQAMDQFKTYREIVIIPNGSQFELKNQLDKFSRDSQGIRERDLRVTVCKTDSCKRSYSQLASENQFTVILIGKDGGTKKAWNRPISTKELFSIIDAMPMRRSEMKNRK